MASTFTKEPTLKKKTFSLSDYKKKTNVDNTSFKPVEWFELGSAFKELTGVPGIPIGGVTVLMGHSNTSKSTAMLLAAADSQRRGRLPVFIITEMKWSWGHAKMLGVQYDEVVDETTGEVNYEGNFIYVDKSTLKTIEDVAQFINRLLDDQEKGKLPYDLDFFWDSVGSVPCLMSVEKGKSNNEWNAGAMSTQFGGSVNQRITASRRSTSEYTNSLICVNKVWVAKPDNPMGKPKMQPKGGTTQYYDSIFVIQFGNIANAGLNKITVKKGSKTITYGSRVSVAVDKNHVTGLSLSGKLIVVPDGYIKDDKKEIDAYLKKNLDYFMQVLGGTADEKLEFDIEDGDDDVLLTEPEDNE